VFIKSMKNVRQMKSCHRLFEVFNLFQREKFIIIYKIYIMFSKATQVQKDNCGGCFPSYVVCTPIMYR
jgi:hypothetical protein